MTRIIIVSGTGTGVGKTIVTAALAAVAQQAGQRVAVVKPVQSGATYDMAGDIDVVGRLVGAGSSLAPHLTLKEFIRYDEPLAPATAARVSGREALTLPETAERTRAVAAEHDLTLVEGAGGLAVHYSDDPMWTIADLARELDAAVLVVASPALGTLNHSSLTLEALALRGLTSAGVVLGAWPETAGLAERTNLEDLRLMTGAGVAGALPEGSGELEPAAFHAMARVCLSPAFGGTFDAADFEAAHDPRDANQKDAS